MATPAEVGTDEVDSIVDAWARERPDLDASPMHVLSRISRVALHLDRLRKKAFSDHALEGWEFDVLSALRRAGAPYELSPGQLTAETMVTSGTMTNRVDRLERRGYVSRHRAPGDRRGVIVRLTDTGRATVDAALDALLQAEHELLAGLPPSDQRSVADALRTLSRSLSG